MTAELITDPVAPDSVGIDPHRLDVLLRRVRLEVEHGPLPSAQVAVARKGQLVAFETWGDAGVRVERPRYLLQSVGRTIVASAVWKLLGQGGLRLEERIADIIPEFGANGKGAVTVEHVLTHTGGFPFAPLGYPKMADRQLRLAAFAKWRLDEPPGRTLQFHLTSAAWLIDEIVYRRSGLELRDFLSREIAEPLSLGFALGVPRDEQAETVAQMRCTDGGATVDPWGPWYLDNPDVVAAGEPAHSVVGTAADVALHYQALLGALGGDERVWSQAVVRNAVRPRVVEVPAGEQIYGGGTRRTAVGLFVVLVGPDSGGSMPALASPGTFGHAGAAYQLGFADPESGVSFAMLSNGYPASGYDYSRRGTAMLANIGNLAADLT